MEIFLVEKAKQKPVIINDQHVRGIQIKNKIKNTKTQNSSEKQKHKFACEAKSIPSS